MLYVCAFRPSADRVMNILIASQFTLEASGTTLMLVQTLNPDTTTSDAQTTAFIVSLLAMIAPVLQRFYDACIVQISKVVRKQGFTWKGFFFSLIGFLVFVPTMVIKLTQCDCGSTVAMSATEMAGDDINKLATKMANEGLVSSVEEGTAEIASRAFWQVHINAEFRRERKITEEEVEAAARLVQARFRSRRAARLTKTRLTKLKMAAALVKRPATGKERPGFQWLEGQMVGALDENVDERICILRKPTATTRKESFIRSLPAGLPPSLPARLPPPPPADSLPPPRRLPPPRSASLRSQGTVKRTPLPSGATKSFSIGVRRIA